MRSSFKQLGWFVVLWTGGVLTVTIVGLAIRTVLVPGWTPSAATRPVAVNLRLDAETLIRLHKLGAGWQGRVGEIPSWGRNLETGYPLL